MQSGIRENVSLSWQRFTTPQIITMLKWALLNEASENVNWATLFENYLT